MQYDTTVNRWHTSKNTARINASNPCSEYMFLDDSACNLASLNLLKFAPNGTFDVEAYRHAVDMLITAQEILVDNAGYPTEAIMKNSHDYRPLGLGYANLGALLMAAGLPYDSDAGRDYAACVTAIMCGEAYLQSSRIAEQCEPLTPATEPTKKNLSETNLGARVATDAFVRPATMQRSEAERREHTADHARWSLPRLVHQPRTVPRRDPHAPRLRERHQQERTFPLRSSKPASSAGTKLSPTARSSDTATARSPCSLPPAPSAS